MKIFSIFLITIFLTTNSQAQDPVNYLNFQGSKISVNQTDGSFKIPEKLLDSNSFNFSNIKVNFAFLENDTDTNFFQEFNKLKSIFESKDAKVKLTINKVDPKEITDSINNEPTYKWHIVKKVNIKDYHYFLILTADVKNIKQVSEQSKLLIRTLNNTNLVSFNAYDFYSEKNSKTEDCLYEFIDGLHRSILENDTSFFYNHLLNLSDLYYSQNITNKGDSANTYLTVLFNDIFNYNYLEFQDLRSDLLYKLKGTTGLKEYSISFRKKNKTSELTKLKIIIPVPNSKPVLLFFTLVKSSRGYVFYRHPGASRRRHSKRIRNKALPPSLLSYRIKYNKYINRNTSELLDDFATNFSSWKIMDDGNIKLNTTSFQNVILSLNQKLEGTSLKGVSNTTLKSITINSQNDIVVINKNTNTQTIDESKLTALEFSELLFDKVLQQDENWILEKIIDSTEYALIERIHGPQTRKQSLILKNRTIRTINSSKKKISSLFKTLSTNKEESISFFQNKTLDSNCQEINFGYNNDTTNGLVISLRLVHTKENGWKIGDQTRISSNDITSKEVLMSFIKDKQSKFDTTINFTSSILHFVKVYENSILSWKFNYKKEKLKSISFLLYSNSKPIIVKVKLADIPKSFYQYNFRFRRLYQLHGSRIKKGRVYKLKD